MGVLDRGIQAALQGKESGKQMFMNLQRLKDLKDQRAQEQADRDRQQAGDEFKYYDSILSDPMARAQLPDEELPKFTGLRSAAASRLGIEAPDVDPIPGAIMQDMYKLQSDPDYRAIAPAVRLRMLNTKWGRHSAKFFANITNAQGLMTAQAVPGATVAKPDQNAGVGTALASTDPNAMAMANPDSGTKTSVGANTASSTGTIADPEEQLANDLFGAHYVKPLPPKDAQAFIQDRVTEYTQAILAGTDPAKIVDDKQSIMDLARSYNIPLTSYSIDNSVKIATDARDTVKFKQLSDLVKSHQTSPNWKAEENADERAELAELANGLNLFGAQVTPDDFLVLGEEDRRKTFYEQKKTDLDIQNTKSLMADREHDNRQQDIMNAFNRADKVEDNQRANDKLNFDMQDKTEDNIRANEALANKNGTGGKDPLQPNSSEQKLYRSMGWNSPTILHAYGRIARVMGDPKLYDTELKELTTAGRKERDKINQQEKELHGKSSSRLGYKIVGMGSSDPIHYGTHKAGGVFDITAREAKSKGKSLNQIAKEFNEAGYVAVVRRKGQRGITNDHIHIADPATAPQEANRLQKQTTAKAPKSTTNLMGDLSTTFGKPGVN